MEELYGVQFLLPPCFARFRAFCFRWLAAGALVLGLRAGAARAQGTLTLGPLPAVAPAGPAGSQALPDFLAVAYIQRPLLGDLRN